MKSRAALAVALLLSIVILSGPELGAQASQQRSLYVTVLDDSGAPVESAEALRPGDFAIREDDDVREVLSVAPADQPMQIAVLVDTSQAASQHIGNIRTALESFVTDMTGGPKHQLLIVGLGERPTTLADGSSDREQVMKGVYRVFEQRGSGNYLLDGIIEVSERFRKQGARHPVVLAITTEGPELSSRRYQDVMKALQDAAAALHVITLGPPANDVSEDARNRSRVLDDGPQTTGGHRDSLQASSALPGALKRLVNELKYQYIVAYARPSTLVPPERITVTATRPGLTARGTPVKEPAGQGRP